MIRRSWDEERLATFLAGPVTWAPLGIFVLVAVAVTISYLDIGVTVGADTTEAANVGPTPGDRAGPEIEAVEGGADGELAAGAGASALGGSVFAANCAACHGGSGEGGVGPALAGRSISSSAVSSVVRSGRGAMPGFETRLSAEEIAAVAAYVSGLGSGSAAGGGTATTTAPPPTQPSGSIGAFDLFCSACHGADGRGTELGRDLRGRDADDVIEVVRFGEDEMPAFPPSVISDAQLVEIIAYVQSIKENER